LSIAASCRGRHRHRSAPHPYARRVRAASAGRRCARRAASSADGNRFPFRASPVDLAIRRERGGRFPPIRARQQDGGARRPPLRRRLPHLRPSPSASSGGVARRTRVR